MSDYTYTVPVYMTQTTYPEVPAPLMTTYPESSNQPTNVTWSNNHGNYTTTLENRADEPMAVNQSNAFYLSLIVVLVLGVVGCLSYIVFHH
jgi:hypothetical protein